MPASDDHGAPLIFPATAQPEIAVPSLIRAHFQQESSPQDSPKLQSDVEHQSPPPNITFHPDPYHLKDGWKNEEQLSTLRSRKSGKKLAQFQSKQNNLIASSLKPIEEYTTEAQIQEEADRLPVKIAVWASLIANFSLCVLQLYAAISSISLSLLATGIDSVFDIGSNLVLFWLHRKSERLDSKDWPVGGARLETIGNIVYGSLCVFKFLADSSSAFLILEYRMASVNLVVVVESCRSIIARQVDANNVNNFHLPSIITVSAALGKVQVKYVSFGKIIGTIYGSTHSAFSCLREGASSADLDPMGAIIIGLGIIIAWLRTIYGEFALLAGKSAPHEMLQLLIYKVATYHEEIEKIDKVRAYHSGPEYFVEIDVVMNADTPLWKSHDVSRRLKGAIEGFPQVERAFVNINHEGVRSPEYRRHQGEGLLR
ncbi:hypothetical protein V5O48_011828 [Marasmius crinis-equi]|uniref:Cation efflux protein cytoplasmic domain-containing protein n=1 Tax=Marasmius crinis-equi TaxID=585013 RepID=A0ABR3F4G3_9AGAR